MTFKTLRISGWLRGLALVFLAWLMALATGPCPAGAADLATNQPARDVGHAPAEHDARDEAEETRLVQDRIAETILSLQMEIAEHRGALENATNQGERDQHQQMVGTLKQQLLTLEEIQRQLTQPTETAPLISAPPPALAPEEQLEAIRNRQERTLENNQEERSSLP